MVLNDAIARPKVLDNTKSVLSVSGHLLGSEAYSKEFMDHVHAVGGYKRFNDRGCLV